LLKITQQKEARADESDPVIMQMASNHLELVQEVKNQVNQVLQLNKRYNAAKGKLVDVLKKKDESSKELKAVLAKRRQLYANKKHLKELVKMRKEVKEAHESLKQDIWREYVDGVHKKMFNSFKKAFEI
jgi:cell shape-determining protein MreC